MRYSVTINQCCKAIIDAWEVDCTLHIKSLTREWSGIPWCWTPTRCLGTWCSRSCPPWCCRGPRTDPRAWRWAPASCSGRTRGRRTDEKYGILIFFSICKIENQAKLSFFHVFCFNKEKEDSKAKCQNMYFFLWVIKKDPAVAMLPVLMKYNKVIIWSL